LEKPCDFLKRSVIFLKINERNAKVCQVGFSVSLRLFV
jgi:hypothetical protein